MTETYTYDADGERLSRTRAGMTTVSLEGVFEEDRPSGAQRMRYVFNGRVVAERGSNPVTFTYLASDHLGSISVAFFYGVVANRQEYTPWGEVRSGDIPETTRDYTGQQRDGTGLLFYNARYYDPALGKFLSPDTIVPGSRALTAALGDRSGAELVAESPDAPDDPQTLNRYAYVLNNPVNHVDPLGHCNKYYAYQPDLLQPQCGAGRGPGGGRGSGGSGGGERGPGGGSGSGSGGQSGRSSQPGRPGGYTQRQRELGTDKRTGQFRPGEVDTAERLEAASGIRLERFDPRANPYKEGDWIDGKGNTYDGIGGGIKSEHFDAQSFNNSITAHLRKQGVDFLAVNVHGLEQAQIAQVKNFLATLDKVQLARIFLLE